MELGTNIAYVHIHNKCQTKYILQYTTHDHITIMYIIWMDTTFLPFLDKYAEDLQSYVEVDVEWKTVRCFLIRVR